MQPEKKEICYINSIGETDDDINKRFMKWVPSYNTAAIELKCYKFLLIQYLITTAVVLELTLEA